MTIGVFCLCAVLTGCASVPAPVGNAADQLTRFSWSGENGESVTFSEGTFRLKTKEVTLSGDYSAGSEELTLITSDSGVLVIPYNIIDDQLVLTYCGMEMFFNKT